MNDQEREVLIADALADFIKKPNRNNQMRLCELVKKRSYEQITKMEIEYGLKNG